MHFIDWAIVAGIFVGLAAIAMITKQYMRGVADFLAANRCAGRYLLTLADGMAGLGAIGIIGSFQQTFTAGLGANWWGGIMGPLMMLLPLTGFIIYRFRESRVMTIAEFYERRYSRRFRIFAGVLAWVAGVINYGVFPQVTARFFIAFCDFPQYYWHIGAFRVDVTLGVVMAVLLITALLITFRGGQIAIMVTDFFQAQLVNIIFIIVLFALLFKFGLSDVVTTLEKAPEGESMLNPFGQQNIPNFTFFFFMIMAFNTIYTYMAWQGNQGYNCSARTPHEAKMARILAGWRYGATWAVITLIPIFAYVLFNSDAFQGQGLAVKSAVDALGDEGLQKQLTVPLALREMLPIGVFGFFVAAMLAAAVSTDDTYLHSWGSIFIQDVYLPLRGKHLNPVEHMVLLRRSIIGVAVFVWCFGMLFPLYDYIFMYWAITGAIYVGGAGSVIIGGFYWKRATTQGAWAGMITGSVLAVTGVLCINIIWPNILPGWKAANPGAAWLQLLPDDFWLDGMEMSFFASLCAIAAFVIGSLVSKPDPNFSMDRLLHRGKYAIEGEHQIKEEKTHINPVWRLLGVTEEYSLADKLIVLSIVVWTAFWFILFVLGTIYGFRNETTDAQWAKYWIFNISVYVLVGIVTVGWFLWGGFVDLKEMFVYLKTASVDARDDGMVDENGNDIEEK